MPLSLPHLVPRDALHSHTHVYEICQSPTYILPAEITPNEVLHEPKHLLVSGDQNMPPRRSSRPRGVCRQGGLSWLLSRPIS